VAHDVVIIGGGPGGYAAAFRAAAHGLDVGLVEAGKVGGVCLHRGCVPSKALLHVAGVLEEVERAEVLGLRLGYEGLDPENLGAFRDGVVAKLHKGLAGLAEERTTVYTGRGRLRAGDSGLAVEVTGEDGQTTTLETANVIVATGSRPRHLPGVEVDGAVVQTSDEALFSAPPGSAVIVGAGAVGMEFASMWRPMGAEVTVVEALDRVLPLEDAEVSRTLARAVKRRGIDVLTDARLEAVRREGEAAATVEVAVGDEVRTLEVERVLVAVGREPVTDEVGLADLGVLDERGFVVVDEWGATATPGLWAVGDVTTGPALAHAAFAEGFVVGDRIAGVPTAVPVDHVQTPRVTYTLPEVASVGLTEAEARERFGDEAIEVSSAGLHGNAKGIIAGSEGLVKVVRATGPVPPGAVGGQGPVLGIHLVGPHATELIGEATLATAWEAVPAELAAITHAHPTLYEVLGEAFLSAAGTPHHGR
jgi:dihydrolipoamide dehydrogenase